MTRNKSRRLRNTHYMGNKDVGKIPSLQKSGLQCELEGIKRTEEMYVI